MIRSQRRAATLLQMTGRSYTSRRKSWTRCRGWQKWANRHHKLFFTGSGQRNRIGCPGRVKGRRSTKRILSSIGKQFLATKIYLRITTKALRYTLTKEPANDTCTLKMKLIKWKAVQVRNQSWTPSRSTPLKYLRLLWITLLPWKTEEEGQPLQWPIPIRIRKEALGIRI